MIVINHLNASRRNPDGGMILYLHFAKLVINNMHAFDYGPFPYQPKVWLRNV